MRVSPIAVALALLLHCPAVLARTPGLERVLTDEQWRDDLRVLAEKLATTHRDPFRRVARDRFEREVAALDARIPTLDDDAVVLGLARLAAMLGDGHTRLTLPEDSAVAFDQAHSVTRPPRDDRLVCHHLPLQLGLDREGLYVEAATEPATQALGARVARIGDIPADSALALLRPFVSSDNDMGFRLAAPHRLEVPEVLHALGLSSDPRRARFTFRDSGGAEFSLALEALPHRATPAWTRLGPQEGAGVPLALRHPARFFWFELLPRQRTLFVQVNRIADSPDERFASFARRLGQFLDRNPVERLVLDLRENAGGNNQLGRSLVLTLARSARINRPGRLFVIVGRGTFSAAVDLASELEFWTAARFVGEPTGGKPSSCGDSRKTVLPASGLTLRVSSVYWRDWTTDEERPWIAPDLPAEPTLADEIRGRDPALEAIFSIRPDSGAVGAIADALRAGNRDAATTAYFKHRTDPETADQPLATDLTRLGRDLLAAGRVEDAIVALSLAANERPGSPDTQLALGVAFERAGRQAEAVEAYRKALELDPKSQEARRGIERLAGRTEGRH